MILQVNSPQNHSFLERAMWRMHKAQIIKINKKKYLKTFSCLIVKIIVFHISPILFLKVQIDIQKTNRNLWNIIKEYNHVTGLYDRIIYRIFQIINLFIKISES